jgi:hypothetical protein
MRTHSIWLAAALSGTACGDGQEPARVVLPVLVDSSGMTPVQTNLGYAVSLSEARAIVEDLEFTIAGEAATASFGERLLAWAVPAAHAHPGHYQGGDVTGELPGRFLVSWLPTTSLLLGEASFIVGAYESGNFTFGRARPGDGVTADDVLLGHTALLRGQATRAGQTIAFEAVIDAPEGRRLIGAPFKFHVEALSQVSLGLQLLIVDPVEGDTLFDDIDFATLPRGADATLRLDASKAEPSLTDAYDRLHRTFQTHDHFTLLAIDPN